jgi:hypothetical protein
VREEVDRKGAKENYCMIFYVAPAIFCVPVVQNIFLKLQNPLYLEL